MEWLATRAAATHRWWKSGRLSAPLFLGRRIRQARGSVEAYHHLPRGEGGVYLAGRGFVAAGPAFFQEQQISVRGSPPSSSTGLPTEESCA